MTRARHRITACSVVIIATLGLLTLRTTSAQQAANAYTAFKALFKPADIKSLFVDPTMPAAGPALRGPSLKFLPQDWQEKAATYRDVAYEPVMTFPFDPDHDAYLVLTPSLLNGKNVNLLVFSSGGTLVSAEIIAGEYGDEGNYATTFGWIRDLNGDHQLDLLLREQQLALHEDNSTQLYAADKLNCKLWNGTSFKNAALPNKSQLKKETDEAVGNFRLDRIKLWASDPRTGKFAIKTYEIWLKTYPGNSHVTEIKKTVQQLRQLKDQK